MKVDAMVDAYRSEEPAKLLGKGEAPIWQWIRGVQILVVRTGGRTLIVEQ